MFMNVQFILNVEHDMSVFITTTDPQRLAIWQRLFGVDRLPVKSDTPRWRVERDSFGREANVLGYDLDASRVHWMARERFAHYVSRKTGHSYRGSDIDGWLIKAAGCEVVTETADSLWRKRPFLFYTDTTTKTIQYA